MSLKFSLTRTHVSPIFFGWWTVLVTGIVSGLGHGFYMYGLSVFFKDIAAELGLSRALTSLATGLGRLEGGLVSPLAGWLCDRFGPKWVSISGLCIAVCGFSLMYFIRSEWMYFIAWGILAGFGINLGLTVTIDKTLTNWFVRKRGLALGLKFTFIGLGGVILLPIVGQLFSAYGWRITCLIWSAVMLSCIPFIALFVKQKRPEHYGLLPDGARMEEGLHSLNRSMFEKGRAYASGFAETEFTFRQALATSSFWMVALSYSLATVVFSGFTIHIVPFLTDFGICASAAGGMMSLMVFFTMPARFFGGIMADRTRKEHLKFILAGSFALLVSGILSFLFFQSLGSIYFLLICHGFTTGIMTPVIIIILGRFFGRQAFGTIFGTCMLFNAPVGLLAPVFTGWIFDRTGSYTAALYLFAFMAATSATVISLVRTPEMRQQ
ncbi:MAG: MFS transporter [Thermodesulfobacteriota bacterium]